MPYMDAGRCPFCGQKANGHENTSGDQDLPAEGDSCICAYCENIAVLHNGVLKKATAEEVDDMNLVDIQQAIAKLQVLKALGAFPAPKII